MVFFFTCLHELWKIGRGNTKVFEYIDKGFVDGPVDTSSDGNKQKSTLLLNCGK